MRTIRALQKQMQDLGERYQDELVHPHASGSDEQALLREIARQMNSVKDEIDVLQRSIVQRQATDGMQRQDKGSMAAVPAEDRAGLPVRAQEAGPPAPAGDSRAPDPTRTVGVVVDTTA